MINIDRLRMHLPAGYQHRATSIAMLVSNGLAKQKVSQSISLESIVITPVQIRKNNSDEEIANLIINKIISGYQGETA